MHRVYQVGRFDCLRACLASLLELSLDEVPDLWSRPRSAAAQLATAQRFAKRHGYALLEIDARRGRPWARLAVPVLAIATVDLPAVGWHAVIVRAAGRRLRLVHDPDPGGARGRRLPGPVVALSVLVPLQARHGSRRFRFAA